MPAAAALTALEKTYVKPANPDGIWDHRDPVIPEALKDRVTVAVYRCPNNHKTKATSLQKATGVTCFKCQQLATVVPIFA